MLGAPSDGRMMSLSLCRHPPRRGTEGGGRAVSLGLDRGQQSFCGLSVGAGGAASLWRRQGSWGAGGWRRASTPSPLKGPTDGRVAGGQDAAAFPLLPGPPRLRGFRASEPLGLRLLAAAWLVFPGLRHYDVEPAVACPHSGLATWVLAGPRGRGCTTGGLMTRIHCHP